MGVAINEPGYYDTEADEPRIGSEWKIMQLLKTEMASAIFFILLTSVYVMEWLPRRYQIWRDPDDNADSSDFWTDDGTDEDIEDRLVRNEMME